LKKGGWKIYSSLDPGLAAFKLSSEDTEYWVMLEQILGSGDLGEEFYLYIIEIRSMKQEIQVKEILKPRMRMVSLPFTSILRLQKPSSDQSHRKSSVKLFRF